ncbi:hypothetical protein J6590_084862 [Homalodisca vitripennis]|nr:hypothetical protein J6590_084862 [Homalodisca vitripennis]
MEHLIKNSDPENRTKAANTPRNHRSTQIPESQQFINRTLNVLYHTTDNWQEPQLNSKANRHKLHTEDKVDALISSDSLLRGPMNIMKYQYNPNIATKIMAGAKTSHCSRFLHNSNLAPPNIILNIGSNNTPNTKTPNHVMRPIWLTVEVGMKQFKETKLYVSSILYRRDVRDKFISDTNGATHYIHINRQLTDDSMGYDGIHPYKRAEVSNYAERMGITTDENDHSQPGREPSYQRDDPRVSAAPTSLDKICCHTILSFVTNGTFYCKTWRDATFKTWICINCTRSFALVVGVGVMRVPGNWADRSQWFFTSHWKTATTRRYRESSPALC